MNEMLRQERPAEILLAEDNENDVILTRESLQQCGVNFRLHHVENGEQCLAFLKKEDRYHDEPTPDILLLDLNMPIMDGRQVLAEIVDDNRLKHIPVVILTTSDNDRDVLQMYTLRCSSYVTKPVSFKDFVVIVKRVCEYWFGTVVLPPLPVRSLAN